MKSSSSRSEYWDIVKGMGIIMIVMGHCGIFSAFVYLFHLSLFFFVTGYFYKEEKYGDDPFLYFSSRLSGCWPRYFFYCGCFVLLHNFCIAREIYPNTGLLNHTAILNAILHNIVFWGSEKLAGSLWFIPVWLVSAGIFGGTVWFGRTAAKRLNLKWVRPVMIFLSSAASAAAALLLFSRKSILPFELHCALLAVPLYYAAWMMRNHLPGFKRYTTWYGAAVSAFLLYHVNKTLHIYIDINNLTIPGILYYPISFLGIYFTLSLAALAEKFRPIAGFLAVLGRHSFDIMALHFLVFKLIDLVYVHLPGTIFTSDQLITFPCGFPERLAPIYLLLGILIPTLIGWAIDRIVRFLLPPAQPAA